MAVFAGYFNITLNFVPFYVYHFLNMPYYVNQYLCLIFQVAGGGELQYKKYRDAHCTIWGLIKQFCCGLVCSSSKGPQ